MNYASVKKHLYYLLAKRPLKLEPPKVIQFPVIDICNSRCQMCRIWENKKSDDITIEELRAGLSSNLFKSVEAVGFNGGEPTLRKDLPELVSEVVKLLPNLKTVSLITNAFKYKQVIEQIDRIGEVLEGSGVSFDVMVSLDGYGEIHDIVRGKEGNFQRAEIVIKHISNSPFVDRVRIGCTVIRDNVYHLHDLLEYCIKNNLYVKYRLGVPHQRLYTENLKEPYALTMEEKYEFIEFLEGLIKYYERNPAQIHFYKSLIGQLANGAPRRAGCDWQHCGATITSKGELAYCAVKSKVISTNIAINDPEFSYFSNKAHLENIIKYDCDGCNHDYLGVPGRSDYLRLIIQKILIKFAFKDYLKSSFIFPILKKIQARIHYRKVKNKFDKIESKRCLANSSSSNKKILVCGWYGTETLGDKAILGGVVSALKKSLGSETEIVVASLFEYITEITKKQMSELHNVRVIGLDKAIENISGFDCLLFGGGPVMAITPMAQIEVLFDRAKYFKILTGAAGIGVGPFGYSWLNNSLKNVLRLCDFRVYRDAKSKENARLLGLDVEHDVVAEDPAFTWLANQPELIQTNNSRKYKKVVLLGLRDFPYAQYATELSRNKAIDIKENYEYSIVKALEELTSQDSDIIIKPLPMCTNHYGDDDRWFYRKLFRNSNIDKNSLDYSLLGAEMNPESYVNEFRKADVLLAMRFHSLVFGISLGVKSLAIDYTMGNGKVTSLSDRFEVPRIDMTTLTAEIVINEVRKLFSNSNTKDQKKITLEDLKFSSALSQKLRVGL